MTDTIPSLRRQLGEAQRRITELQERENMVVYVDRPVIEYVDKPRDIIQQVFVDRPVVEYVDRIVEVPVAFEVEVPQYPQSTQVIREEVLVYVDNPQHELTIKLLQERLAECTSQLDLLLNQPQE